MLKKLIVLGIVGFVAVSAVKGSKLAAFIEEKIEKLTAKSEPKGGPGEKDIKRLRDKVKDLDKDVMNVVNQLAKERVEVNHLRDRAEELRASQSKSKELLQARAAAIDAATEQVTFGDRKLSITAAKVELDEGMKRYTANQKSLASLEASISSHIEVRDGLEKQLETLRSQKAELTAAIDALEAEMTELKLQQMKSKYQTDDSRLGKIKEDIRETKTKLEIEREKLKLMPAAFDPPAPSPEVVGKSGKEIIAGLTPATPTKPTTAPKVPVIE